MKCLKPITLKNGITVNCGRCRACRVNRSTMWTLRLIFELDKWKYASFVTLTYNEDKIPEDFGLCKRDLQLFIKRLRSRLSEDNRRLVYYAVGEYGSDNRSSPIGIEHGRPHYHLIIFGLNPDPYDEDNKDRDLIADCWENCDRVLFGWKRSNNAIDFVNRVTIGYVTGYVQKKLNGQVAKEYYADRQPPFMQCSHYLGLEYFDKWKNYYFDLGYIRFKGHKNAVPRYFRKKYNIELEFDSDNFDVTPIDEFLRSVKDYDLKSNSVMKRLYKDWLARRMYKVADVVEHDYLQRQKIVGGKI